MLRIPYPLAVAIIAAGIALTLSATVCQAGHTNRRQSTGQRLRYVANPENVDVTPYPSADELKPEIAFEEGDFPAVVYGTPPGQAERTPNELYGAPPQLDMNDLSAMVEPSAKLPRAPLDGRQFQQRANLRRLQAAARKAGFSETRRHFA